MPPGKYRGMVNLQEGYMENVMDAIVGWKVEPIGHGIDTLRDTKEAQFCVIEFGTWTSGCNIAS